MGSDVKKPEVICKGAVLAGRRSEKVRTYHLNPASVPHVPLCPLRVWITNWLAVVAYKPSELLPLFSSPCFRDARNIPCCHIPCCQLLSRITVIRPELIRLIIIYPESSYVSFGRHCSDPRYHKRDGLRKQSSGCWNMPGNSEVRDHRRHSLQAGTANSRQSPIGARRVLLTMVWVVRG